MLYKGPYPCRALLQIPFILQDTELSTGTIETLMSNVDVAPTLLGLLGIPVPEFIQGRSFASLLRGEENVPPRDVILVCGWSKDSPLFYHHTVYTRDHRLSFFPYQNNGELYLLESDPHELTNLYSDPQWSAAKHSLMSTLLSELGRAEAPNSPAICLW
jgi:arylsulfatase A-like enzyme